MASTIQHAGRLFNVALQAANNIKAGWRDRHQEAALVSLVFAVVSLEAFFNEAVELAEMCLTSERALVADGRIPKFPEPSVVSLFAQEMAKQSTAPLLTRVHIANRLLTGRKAGKKAQPFRDLALLLRLRNQLVHFRPNEIYAHRKVTAEMLSTRGNSIVEELRPARVLATNIVGVTGWTDWIETKAMAKWSCDVASRVVFDFLKKVPSEGQWGIMLSSAQGFFLLGLREAWARTKPVRRTHG
jgi:hypothetical protein